MSSRARLLEAVNPWVPDVLTFWLEFPFFFFYGFSPGLLLITAAPGISCTTSSNASRKALRIWCCSEAGPIALSGSWSGLKLFTLAGCWGQGVFVSLCVLLPRCMFNINWKNRLLVHTISPLKSYYWLAMPLNNVLCFYYVVVPWIMQVSKKKISYEINVRLHSPPSPNAVLMLEHRLRPWPNISTF